MFSKSCKYGIKATLYIAQRSQYEERVSLKEIAAAIKTPAFKRLANALNISDGRGFLEAALLASSTNESSVGPAEAATPEAQAMYDSVKVPTMQFDADGATAALIRSLRGTDAAAQVQEAAQ